MSRRWSVESSPAARRRASILRIVSFPVTAILVVIAVKLIAMVIVAQVTIVEYADESYESSAQAAQWNLAVNVVEPHKAHFNLGTAFLGSRLFEKARAELEEALATAPLPDSCDVRINLSFAIEGLGDDAYAAGELEDAITLYEDAASVLAEADESCGDTTERQEELAEKADAVREELEEQQDPAPSTPEDPDDGDAENPFEQIEERNGRAEQERQDQENADRGYEYGDGGPAKPW